MKLFSIVPEKYVYVLERFGKFQRLLKPGFRVLIPLVDQIAYKQHLMEQGNYVRIQLWILINRLLSQKIMYH
jgi:regulator of protease activity HflC (stomatin/prohibitin superfamily)